MSDTEEIVAKAEDLRAAMERLINSKAIEALGFAFAYMHTWESQGLKVADLSVVKMINAWNEVNGTVRR